MSFTPPFFQVLQDDPGVRSVLGDPIRAYKFGEAEDSPGLAKPYVVWQTVYGEPEDYLGDPAELVGWTIRAEIVAETSKEAEELAELLLKVLERHCYFTIQGTDRDLETKDFLFVFDLEWLHYR